MSSRRSTNGWEFTLALLDRLPGWPTERQWVTAGIFALGFFMLWMADVDPSLWEVKLFELLIQAVFISAIINMIIAFHYAANKGDEEKTENTRHAFEAIRATAEAGRREEPEPDVELKPGETARAVDETETRT